MAAKSVAVEGDIIAAPGSVLYPGASQGTWTAGSITTQSYDRLTVMGRKVIYKASCTFSFSGTGPPPSAPPVTGSETVDLEATTTLLMKGESSVLVQGDSKTDTFGNQLTVESSTKKIKTS